MAGADALPPPPPPAASAVVAAAEAVVVVVFAVAAPVVASVSARDLPHRQQPLGNFGIREFPLGYRVSYSRDLDKEVLARSRLPGRQATSPPDPRRQ